MAPVGRVEQLGATVVAGRDVGRDELVGGGLVGALENAKGRRALRRGGLVSQGGDEGPWRRLARQSRAKRRHRRLLALDLDLDAGRGVAHPAVQAAAQRQVVDEGPKTDALHHAAHAQASRRQFTLPPPCGRQVGHRNSWSSSTRRVWHPVQRSV